MPRQPSFIGVVLVLALSACLTINVPSINTGPSIAVTQGDRQEVPRSGPSGLAAFAPITVAVTGAPAGTVVTFTVAPPTGMICDISRDDDPYTAQVAIGVDGTATLRQMPQRSSMICHQTDGQVAVTAAVTSLAVTTQAIVLVGQAVPTLTIQSGNNRTIRPTREVMNCLCIWAPVVVKLANSFSGAPLVNQQITVAPLGYTLVTGSDGIVRIGNRSECNGRAGLQGEMGGSAIYQPPTGSPLSVGYYGNCIQPGLQRGSAK